MTIMERREFLIRMAEAGAALAGLTVVGELFIPFAEAADIRPFSFAHLSDLHLDVRGESTWQHREKSIPLFIDALKQVVRLPKLDFLVFGGDQIHYGGGDKDSLKVFQEWIKQLEMPIYILLGNTEVSPVRGASTLGRDEYLAAWNGRGLGPGRSSWTFEPGRGVRVIGWDVTVDGRPHGEATPERISWLEQELAASRNRKLVILITHQQLLPTTDRDQQPIWSVWMVKNHEQVRELLAGYPNVRLAIAGHHHACRVETVGRTTYVSDPAVVSYPCAFRMFTVSREGIRIRTVGMDDRETVARARELLIRDPYARIYDPSAPERAAEYSEGLRKGDREAMLRL